MHVYRASMPEEQQQQQQQQAGADQQPSGLRPVLQRGHSGEGARTALELLRKRRDLESLDTLPSDAPDPDPAQPE